MWKYVSKAVKDAFEKGNGLFHCRSLNIQERKSYGYGNSKDAKPSCVGSTVNDGNEESCNDNCKGNAPPNLSHNIFTALTCSTAMVFGWYVSQFLYVKDRSFKYTVLQPNKYKGLFAQKIRFPNTVWAQPITIRNINNEKPEAFALPSTTSTVNIDEDDLEQSRTSAIENAAEQFAYVTGNLENQLGAAYLQQSQASVGVEHFEAGALYKNASAAFNLGLCYELGVGTRKDYEKAANCYQIATELGHTKAMYNLAIYYIQGRGGLPIDFNRARLLFIEAAKRGHKESIAALSAECADILCRNNNQKENIVTERVHSQHTVLPLFNGGNRFIEHRANGANTMGNFSQDQCGL